MIRWATTAVALLVLGSGCIEELDPASLVKGPRPIAARVSVDGDPEVASPAPGQDVAVEFLVASGGDPPPFAWGFVLCPGIVTSTGDAICTAEPFAFALQEEPVPEAPSIAFTVPPGFSAERVVVLGVVCADGTPVIDMESQDAGCEPGAGETLVRFDVDVVEGGDPVNHNPGLPAALTFGDRVWEPSAAEVPPEGCEGAGVPTVRAGGDDVVIDFEPAGFVRDIYERFDGEEVPEELVISHFATAGELERLISLVGDPDADPAVDWTPPAAGEPVPAAGQRVRFWFVFRDRRGGVSWTGREACLLP